jgi:hypothetical protein
MFARIRKAVVAGVGAGITAGIGSLFTSGAPTREHVVDALGVALVAAVTVGTATWRVPNQSA